jgi:hypothetical protein
MRNATIAVLLFALVGCAASYEQQLWRLEKLMAWNKIGSGSDVWLVKSSFAGAHKVALVFGFYSDFEFCREIAELYMKRFPADSYSCSFAN